MIWISVEEELPPCDGEYKIRCCKMPENGLKPGQEKMIRYYHYDGFGFMSKSGHYRNAKFWKKEIPPEKKYGKVKKDQS